MGFPLRKRISQIMITSLHINNGFFHLLKSIIYSYILKGSEDKLSIISTKNSEYFIRYNVISDLVMIAEISYDIYKSNNIKGDVLIDIGGYIGPFSLENRKNFKKIYSIEPLKRNYSLLLKNIKLNKAKSIIPLRLAIGEEGEVTIGSPSINNLCISHISPKNPAYKEKVSSVSLSNLLKEIKEKNIVIKIDCEGCEEAALFSLNKKDTKNIKAIIIELHRKDKPYLLKINKKISSLGFYVDKEVRDLGYLIYIIKPIKKS